MKSKLGLHCAFSNLFYPQGIFDVGRLAAGKAEMPASYIDEFTWMRLCIFTQVIPHSHQRFIDLNGVIKKALKIRKSGLLNSLAMCIGV
jgi:hypothetical protein